MQGNYTPDVGNQLAATALQSWPIASGSNLTLAETAIGMQGNNTGMQIGTVYIVPTAAVTASDSTFWTITVGKRTAGGSRSTIATATTKTSASGGTGSWTAFVPVAIPVSAGAYLAPGDVVTLQIAVTSTPGTFPASQLEIFVAVE